MTYLPLNFQSRLTHLSPDLLPLFSLHLPIERPMKVELAIDPNQARSSLVNRVAPAPAQPQKKRAPASKPRNPRPAKKTAEQLDAEMAVCSRLLIIAAQLTMLQEYKQSSTA